MEDDSGSDTGFGTYDSDQSDVIEDSEERGTKRKYNDEGEAEIDKTGKLIGKKRRQLRKENALKKLHRPPTVDELNRLKETENLFHSNLFRLQIEEMIKGIQLKKKYKKEFGQWFEKLSTWIVKMEDKEEKYDLSDISWLKKSGIKFPLYSQHKVKGVYQFKKPGGLGIIGSYQHELCVGPDVTVDVFVKMPQTFFQKGDYMNTRYHRKRALYLCEIAHHLEFHKHLVQEVHFVTYEGDNLRPLLELKPTGKLGQHVTVLLRPVPDADSFKLNRFAPCKNNVRPSWFFSDESVVADAQTATPWYNSSILADMTSIANNSLISQVVAEGSSLREAIVLIKVWLRQRQLHHELSGFAVAMLVCHLVRIHRVNSNMSSYQVLRTFCTYLSTLDPKQGLTLYLGTAGADENLPTLEDFTAHHAFTLVDPSGYHNAVHGVSDSALDRLRHEARLALRCLDTPTLDSFHALFMTPLPFLRSYDHLILFKDRDIMESVANTHSSRERLLSHCGVAFPLFRDMVHGLLSRGMGARARHFHVEQPPRNRWGPRSKPRSCPTLVLGVKLDPAACTSVVDKASGEDLNSAEQFREFWGEKSELRRFQDGCITEAVVWDATTISEKRLIVRQIARYLLKEKWGLQEPGFLYLADELKLVEDHVEEETLKVLQGFDRLTRMLRDLKDLPLNIVSVQGVSPVFRYTEPCTLGLTCRPHDEGCPPWRTPIQAVVQLGPSNKWPRDVEAIRRIRAAFNLKIADSVRRECRLPATPLQEGFQVSKDSVVYHLRVFYPGELGLLKQTTDETGMVQYRDTARSLTMELEGVHLPRLTSCLHGIHNQHNSYGAAGRMVKRWVSAHLLDAAHIGQEALELLMAYVYLRPEPAEAPCQPQAAFLRFLHLVSNTNWNTECLVLNINDEMTREDVLEVESHFNTNRANLPTMFIATPQDKFKSQWTQQGPNPLILLRLMELCRSTLALLEASMRTGIVDHQSLLKPSLSVYDVIIYLSSAFNPRRFAGKSATSHHKHRQESTSSDVPVAGFDPVTLYVSELRAAYDDVALFFYDTYGGEVVTVLWKPDAMTPRPFKTSHVACRTWNTSTNQLELNKAAILEDLCHLGRGLVTRLDVKENGDFVSIYK